MPEAFLFVIGSTLASLLGSDWIRHRENSIVSGLADAIHEVFGEVTDLTARVLGVASAFVLVLAGASGIWCIATFVG